MTEFLKIFPCAIAYVACLMQPASAASVIAYPTVTRVEYVLACLASRDNSRDNLYRCACTIDYIASEVSIDDYDRIETILRMRQVSGERSGLFRDVQWMSDALAEFEAVEKKATAACFGNRR